MSRMSELHQLAPYRVRTREGAWVAVTSSTTAQSYTDCVWVTGPGRQELDEALVAAMVVARDHGIDRAEFLASVHLALDEYGTL